MPLRKPRPVTVSRTALTRLCAVKSDPKVPDPPSSVDCRSGSGVERITGSPLVLFDCCRACLTLAWTFQPFFLVWPRTGNLLVQTDWQGHSAALGADFLPSSLSLFQRSARLKRCGNRRSCVGGHSHYREKPDS